MCILWSMTAAPGRGRPRETRSIFAGIDIGAVSLHCAALDEHGRLVCSGLFAASNVGDLLPWLEGAQAVAVDAPAQLSTAPHDDDQSLSLKFRPARCAEIALARDFGYWVPWVTPRENPSPWMATGLRVHDQLQALRIPVLEMFPYAGFRELADGAKLPKKQTVAGVEARVALLRHAGVQVEHLQMWSHDSIDAVLGALVALHYHRGIARSAGCGHDESAIWLPLPSVTVAEAG
jgi:predicted nuclease with RNAse H fold